MAFNKTDLYIETLIREFPNKVNWDEISCNKNINDRKSFYDPR